MYQIKDHSKIALLWAMVFTGIFFPISRGEEGILEYTEIKTVTVKISQKNS
jgi:hypothetical protein